MTPDKRVEEIVREFFERNDCIMCYGKEDKQRERLTQTLQAERTKRDEMVEAERIRAAQIVEELMEDSEHWQPIPGRILERTIIRKKDITQPNNLN